MDTKEKLEIAWKYLALILIAILGFTWIESNHFIGGPKKGEFVFIDDDDDFTKFSSAKKMDVNVKKEIVNGDTIMNVTVNGKPVDASKFDETNNEMKWTSENGEIHIIKMRHDDERANGDKKMIRKKIKDMKKRKMQNNN